MKQTRTLLCMALLLIPSLATAASKEIIELQRDVAQLQEQMRLLQQSLDTKTAQLQVLTQQTLDSANKANTSVSDLARSVQASGSDIGKQVIQPIAALGSRMDQVSNDMRAVQDSVADQSARMGKIEQQLLDLKNLIATMQAPAAAPPPTATGGGAGLPPSSPGAALPPSSATGAPVPDGGTGSAPPIPAATLYQNAKRDMDGGQNELALNEFGDYLRFYRNTDLAPNAQFNIGEIHYRQKRLDLAVKDYDQVLEAFPVNPKTPDAHYMKGRALIQLGLRNEATKEFNAVLAQFPNSSAAANSKAVLKTLNSSPAAPAAKRRR